MTQSNWVIRPAVAADKLAVLELINTVQPHIPWTSEQYHWQFVLGPAGSAELRVVECDGTLVSLYVGTRKELWIRGNVRPAIMVQDVLTLPRYRGRGMLNALATSFLAEMRKRNECGYTFPNKLSENSFRRSGWHELMPVPALECAVASQNGDAHFAIEVATFDSSVDVIWQNAALPVGVLRSAEYLNWRYSRPGAVYRKFVVPGAGYLVLKSYNRGTQTIMHICDLVLQEHARGLCKSTLAFVQSVAAQSGADWVTSWVPSDHPYRPTFDETGFVRDAKNDRFIFTTGPDEFLPALTSTSSWHLSQGDSDVY